MSDVIIRAVGISKSYRIGTATSSFGTLYDTISASASELISRIKSFRANAPAQETIRALDDISFEVRRGDVIGFIGRNGAGKSTILKILSRITEPTDGFIEVDGRIASLLEVGVGFHGELSGRENIYLNGAILGMKRAEIARKFDEIVEFAGVEKFIGTPVKRYSSGMYVRLAFAVAAHLEPEILLVDEVLAVGDMEFQKKCLGKMGDIAKQGRTVLFVSHNMAAIKQLCQRGMVLSHGKLVADTEANSAVELYLSDGTKSDEGRRQWEPPPNGASAWPVTLEMRGQSGGIVTNVAFDQAIELELIVQVYEACSFQVAFIVFNSEYVRVFTANSTPEPTSYAQGLYSFCCHFPKSLLAPDLYRLCVAIHYDHREIIFREESALNWVVEETGSSLAKYHGKRLGIIAVEPDWEIKNVT